MPHYRLFHDVIDDKQNQRLPFRAAHFGHANAFVDRVELLLGGALAQPVDGAVLLSRTEAAAQAFAANDPYVLQGLVTRWRVWEWATVVERGVPA